jgi:hypothetical protein
MLAKGFMITKREAKALVTSYTSINRAQLRSAASLANVRLELSLFRSAFKHCHP